MTRVRDAVAEAVTTSLLARQQHPHTDATRDRLLEIARRDIDFVALALELADPLVFADYALWRRHLTAVDQQAVGHPAQSFEDIGFELSSRLLGATAASAQAVLSAGRHTLTSPEGQVPDPDRLSPACRLYLAASVSGHRTLALAIVREIIRGGQSQFDVYIDIFQSALYEVGRRWEATGLTIAEEHMATATTQFILSVLHEEHIHGASSRGTAVVTGVVNEEHAVGASIIANALDADGWDVRFLGTNLPHDGIITAIERHQANLVAISVTMSSCVPDTRDLIEQIRRGGSPTGPRIIVGGGAFRADPDLWRTIGADGYAADVRSAVDLAQVQPGL